MPTATLTLTDFLLARIAEDEAQARIYDSALARELGMKPGRELDSLLANDEVGDMGYPVLLIDSTRVLAECQTKRATVALHSKYNPESRYCQTCTGEGDDSVLFPCPTLHAVAAVYADRSDYQDEWRT